MSYPQTSKKAKQVHPNHDHDLSIRIFDTMSVRDPWPQLANGSNFDGRNLVDLVKSGNSPFSWDVILFVRDIEENLDERVVDIPFVYGGSNHYVSLR